MQEEKKSLDQTNVNLWKSLKKKEIKACKSLNLSDHLVQKVENGSLMKILKSLQKELCVATFKRV